MSRMMRSKFVAFVCAFLLPVTSFAAEVDSKNDKITTNVKKGSTVPYDGLLLTHRLAAEVLENCKPEIIDARCKAKTAEAVALCESKCKSEKTVLQVSVDACQKKYEDVNAAHKVQVGKLEARIDELTPKWYESPKLWFAVGIVIGGGTVIAVARSL